MPVFIGECFLTGYIHGREMMCKTCSASIESVLGIVQNSVSMEEHGNRIMDDLFEDLKQNVR